MVTAANNKFFGSNPDDFPKREGTRVKSIECVTPLDDGSRNDGLRINLQKGIVFGKTYEFRVKEFTNEESVNPDDIKWAISYTDVETGVYENNNLKEVATGTSLSINFGGNVNSCGTEITIKAYIENLEAEGKLTIWKHNRFRWFDKKIFDKEIEDRTAGGMPWLINQAGTSLCGMTCIFYLFAKEQPQAYKKFAKDLFRKGEAIFNSYTVKPSSEILEKEINTKGHPLNTSDMPITDFVTLAGTRNTENPDYKGGDEEFEAINWPPLMTRLSEKLLGYSDVSSRGVYIPIIPLAYTNIHIMLKIDDINEQLTNGYKLILMIDSDLIDDIWDYKSADYHWVVLESPITLLPMLNKNGKNDYLLDFKVYSWATDPNGKERCLKAPITMSHFMNNYYGYIKVK